VYSLRRLLVLKELKAELDNAYASWLEAAVSAYSDLGAVDAEVANAAWVKFKLAREAYETEKTRGV
jgi:hypothetical protein